jgi:hypothetical protein
MLKNLTIAVLAGLLALSVATTTQAHQGGGKSGVQQVLDNPGAFTEGHAHRHWHSYVQTQIENNRFIPE